MTIRIRPRAIRELGDLAEHLGNSSISTARRFEEAAEQTFATLEQMAGIGAPCELSNPLLQDVRCWPVKGFKNHLIYYRPIEGGIEVLHLFHAAQDVATLLEQEAE